MNETRGNARTKPRENHLKEREINSLKDSEKTEDNLKIKACLTNKSDLWKTPKNIYNYFANRNYFDPCPCNPQFNGLEIEWKEKNFVNPPYSKIKQWIKKAIYEKNKGKISVLLIPARTDTKWFRELVINNSNFIFIQGRLHFDDKGPAPFPSMLVGISNMLDYPKFEYLTKEQFKKWFDCK